MSDAAALVLSLVAFPIVFVAFWSGVCALLGLFSGWQGLARRYGTDAPAPARQLGLTSGGLGLVSYRTTLLPAATPDGLDLRVLALFRPGHPPLRIPWTEIADEGAAKLSILPMVRLRLGVDGPVLRLPTRVWTELQRRREPYA